MKRVTTILHEGVNHDGTFKGKRGAVGTMPGLTISWPVNGNDGFAFISTGLREDGTVLLLTMSLNKCELRHIAHSLNTETLTRVL